MPGIRVELELNDGTFTTRMLRAGQSVSDLTQHLNQQVVSLRRVEENFSSLGQVVQRTVIGLGAATAAFSGIKFIATDVVSNIVKVNAEFERLTTMMKGMSTASDRVKDAADQVKYLRDMAKEVPFSLGTLQQAFTQLKATGIDPMAGALKGLTDAAAGSGSTGEQLKRAALAMSQMAGKGVVQMEELRQQLGEAIPRATELMARGMGITYADLVKKLAAGTVEAKAAIAAMSGEFERVFGGSAAAQMQTFNGQVSLMYSRFTDLALKVGESGFFDNVKTQLTTLNGFLGSATANAIATSIGGALNTAVTGIATFVQAVVDARGEIMRIGQAFLYAFGAQQAYGLILKTTEAVSAMGGSIAIAAGQLGAWRNQLLAGQTVTQALTGSVLTLGTAGRVAAVGVGALAIGLNTIMPILPLLAVGVALVASYFDFFGNKAKDAWKEMEQFGATSRKQIAAAAPLIEQEKQRLEELNAQYQRDRNYQIRITPRFTGLKDTAGEAFDERNKTRLEEIINLRTSVTQKEIALAEFTKQVEARIAEDKSRKVVQEAEKESQGISARYDQELSRLEQNHKEVLKRNNEAKKDNTAANATFGKLVRAEQSKLYDDQLVVIDRFISQQRDLLKTGNEDERRAADLSIAELTKKRRALLQAQINLQSTPVGAQEISKGIDFEKLFKKGQDALTNLKGDIAGAQAELAGMHGEAAKLAYQLQIGMKFGDIGVDRVKALSAALIEAQEAKSKLDDLLEGKSKLERDLTNAEIRLIESKVELETKGASEAEKIIARVKAGLYKGFTVDDKGQIVSKIDSMRGGFAGMIAQVNLAKNAIDQAIGPSAVDRANTFAGAVDGISSAFGRLKGATSGISLPNGPVSVGAGFGAVSGSLVDKIVGVESGGKSNAKNPLSSATGPGQFIDSTWNQFLAEMHKDLLGTPGSMDLRKDKDMSREAVAWYANKNAGYLAEHGKDPTDANVYLAHFLGPQGAMAVLNANMMTMTSAILTSKQIDANRSILAGKSAGEVIAWAQNKVGGAKSYDGTAGSFGRAAGSQTSVGDSMNSGLARVDAADRANIKAGYNRALIDDLEEVAKKSDQARKQLEGLGKKEAEITAGILNGRYGDADADKDPLNERYKKLLETARQFDQEEDQRAKKRKERSAAERALEQQGEKKLDVATRDQLAGARFNDPNALKFSDGYLQLENQLRREEDVYKKVWGEESAQLREFQERNAGILAQYRNTEILQVGATYDEKIRQARRASMTEQQIREDDLRHELDVLSKQLVGFTGTEEQKTALLQKQSALRQALVTKTNLDNPIAKQMKDWSDIGGNLQKATTGWMDGFADNLATMFTKGTADWKAFSDGIIKDVAKMALKGLMGNLFGAGFGGGGAGKAAGAAASGGGASKLVGAHHSGGIAGGPPTFRRAMSPAHWAGAPRFHTGGIIGSDEVPIIAKKGEGVFTPEQMAAMGSIGGGAPNQISQAVHVTVNGSSGSHEQNQDLADKVGRSVKDQLRQMMTGEIRQQMRPGGVIYNAR